MRKIVFLLLFIWTKAFPQITVDYPYNNQVLQRDKTNFAEVSFLGKLPANSSKVEYKLIQILDSKELNSDWKVLDSVAIGGFYQGKLTLKGGWYKFKVRTFSNGIPSDSATLNRFGVGEVFIIAGQSNAQGVEREAFNSGTTNEMVISANFSNNATPTATDDFSYIGPNGKNFPLDKFEVIKSSSIIGPLGINNFFWPKLGETIVANLKVPVCFFNVAWSGTSIRNWAESSRGIASKNPWIDAYYPAGFPFDNLQQVLKKYSGVNGVRAVLWQIGETDNVQQMSTNDFVRYFKEVSSAVSSVSGLSIPFLLAQSTYIRNYDGGSSCGPLADNSKIVAAYNELFNYNSNLFLPGVNSDLIEVPRLAVPYLGCTHFSPNAFNDLANGWYAKLQVLFSGAGLPVSPLSFPILDKFCSNSNVNVYRLGADSFDILNSNNEIVGAQNSLYDNLSGKTFTIKYKKNNFIEFQSPIINSNNFPIPAQVSITANGNLNFCNGNQVELKNSGSSLVYWNNGAVGSSIFVTKTGEYSAVSKNQFACQSAPSNLLKVTVFENPATPQITLNSPYVLYGGLKLFDIDYHWQNSSGDLQKSDTYLRVNQTGTYKLYASKTYNSSLTCNSAPAIFNYTLPNDAGLSAFPNPVFSDDLVKIESISDLTNANYQLVDYSGRIVKEGKITSDQTYNLALTNLASGKYIISVSTADQKTYSKQIVVQ